MFSRRGFLTVLLLLLVLSWYGQGSAGQLTLSWTDNSSNEDGFTIERQTGLTGTFAEVGTASANANSYVDSNLPAATTYCYRVRAFNTTGDSDYSNEACGATPTEYALSVVRSGTGSGSVTSMPSGISCGTDCSEPYANGTTVTLTAAPEAGSAFAGWSGGGCGGTGSCLVTVTGSTTVTASFMPPSFVLTVTKAGKASGSVSSTPSGISCGTDCSEPYGGGMTVTLTAAPDGGSAFAGWSGGGCSGKGNCTVTLSADTVVTATFKRQGRLR
jgi:hypothetical protein